MKRWLTLPCALLALTALGAMPTMNGNAHAPVDQALMHEMTAMNGDMTMVRMNGNADHDFLVMMIAHHEGAVGMCRVELRYGRNPKVLALCRDIIASQSSQIQMMKRLLAR